jgi:hypothetical protein
MFVIVKLKKKIHNKLIDTFIIYINIKFHKSSWKGY